jgi:hypothetical protein
MKRALYYGFGNDDPMREEIKKAKAEVSGLDNNGIVDLVVRTFRLIRERMITPDPDDEKKRAVPQTTGDLKTSESIPRLHTVNIQVPRIGKADVFFTMPRSLYAYAFVKELGRFGFTNGSIGPNLMDLDNKLQMSSAFSGGLDHTRRVHTSVLDAIESAGNIKLRQLMVLLALHIHKDAIQKANKEADELARDTGVARDQDQEKVAYAMHAFWGWVYERFAAISDGSDESPVTVVPLAHSHTSGGGYATFQLLVTFEESFLREAAAGVIDDVKKIKGWTDAEAARAWMGVLNLLLDGVNGAKKNGGYYTLAWNSGIDEEPKRRKIGS